MYTHNEHLLKCRKTIRDKIEEQLKEFNTRKVRRSLEKSMALR